MNSIPARAVAVATALTGYEHLPLEHFLVGYHVGLTVPSSYLPGLDALREVAVWAREFGTEVILSLSFGDAAVETNIELNGEPVSVKGRFGTAQAYELGRLLQRELNRDVSIHIGADELLAAIDQVVAP